MQYNNKLPCISFLHTLFVRHNKDSTCIKNFAQVFISFTVFIGFIVRENNGDVAVVVANNIYIEIGKL